MDGFNAFPWGAYLFKHCLNRWKSTLPERKTKQVNLGDFSYALLVFAFEVALDIVLLARRRLDTTHLPRICHWEFTCFLNYPKIVDAKDSKLFSSQGQVAKGDEGRDVQDDIPEQVDAPYEHDARPDDPTVLQEVLIPEYRDVPSHIPAVFDQIDVIDATDDLGYIVYPPEGDHEAPVPMVRANEASPVRIPPLQQHNIELRE
ncbi:F-box protein At2g02240 [Olea europaea subsp. europaea]|uniref:F-box protein At2g02240 n=1 Tax=Olea europaea subsp. europaea TaxID=158383 RepID=A0A8S0RZU5_OLEEU|nr:F-box protein At2g02240 [Olea europaea subsp. europaea]